MHLLGLNLKSQIKTLQQTMGGTQSNNVQASIESAAAVASLISSNKYFNIPQSVSSIFTGRETLLEELKQAFEGTPANDHMQKRFIIYGLGGSGKTQFCCKFAQDNRENFWGIFWIDATSIESAKHTLNAIAKIGGVEPNERAAKNWLSGLEHPWLLVIDSADDPRMLVDEYFPEGERGHVLVTTRNPAHRVHGTIGSKFYHFERLEDHDANALLLRAAGEPSPWDASTEMSAALITKALGFLPLALVHAGRAILNRLCTLTNYLDFYEKNWQRIRRAYTLSGHTVDESDMNVYSSYEVIYVGLEAAETEEAKDAIQLLKIFSFFYCEHIRFDFLTQAAINPGIEEEHQKMSLEAQNNASSITSIPQTWTQTIRNMVRQVLVSYYNSSTSTVLPSLVRYMQALGSFDDLRLRVALKELSQMSLITHHLADDTDIYSMHPLVHKWVRERPQMSTAEQALWCDAAATTLAQCILLPPLGASESDEELRRDLLPHLDQVRKYQREIRTKINGNLKRRRIAWPNHTPAFDRGQARQCAKFSRVYSQCGRWDDAERLQLAVKDFLCDMLGPEHPYSIEILLALSNTYWQQSRGIEAAEVQQQVLQSCMKSLGPNHHKTLKVMTILGVSREYQGYFKAALPLQEQALEGLERTLGPDHEDTLIAFDNLGRIQWRYWRYDEAEALHSKAIAGMKKTLGPKHLSTLTAMENLAMTYFEKGGVALNSAQELMIEVREQRKKILGKESPYTLLAICNLARIKSALGKNSEAEEDMLAALPIAERNLGGDHIGVLAARMHLARVFVRQQRYREAEDMLIHVIERYQHQNAARNGEHPDRIMAMFCLMQCYKEQGKIYEAILTGEDMTKALSVVDGHYHPIAKLLADTMEDLHKIQYSGGIPGTLPQTSHSNH